MSTLRIDYDDDLMDVMDHVNAALADSGLIFVDDGEIHDGWMIYTLTKIEPEETDEDYEKRTGEPRGAGADWAGRTRGDFEE